MAFDDAALAGLADRLVAVPGVVGVVLGGSRARGAHHDGSDWDLGLYYRGELDVERLGALAREVSGPDAEVTRPGDWGPWVDGGGWLTVDDAAVDWLCRDLDRVRDSWAAAQRGEVAWHVQAGHPLGVPGFLYAGELALGRVLADPGGELTSLRAATEDYPLALADALVEGLWESEFLLPVARKGAVRNDASYVAGCLFRVVLLCAHALHGRAGRWLINEKGAVAAAGELPGAPTDFATRAQALLAAPGASASELAATLDDAEALVREVREGRARGA